jgi:phycocyanin-associated rod protein
MKVSANARATGLNSDRQVTLTVTALSNNDYSRTADMVMNIPYSRMGQTMRLINGMGGKITGVHVSGGAASPAESSPPRRKRANKEAQG